MDSIHPLPFDSHPSILFIVDHNCVRAKQGYANICRAGIGISLNLQQACSVFFLIWLPGPDLNQGSVMNNHLFGNGRFQCGNVGTKRSSTIIGAQSGHTCKRQRASASAPALVCYGSPGRTRTSDRVINSHLLYQLSYRGLRSAKFREATRYCQPANLCYNRHPGMTTCRQKK